MKMEIFEFGVYAKGEIIAGFNDLDKAVKYGTLHKNTASRKKARLAALVATAGKAVAAE